MRVLLIILSLIPGAAAILLGRTWRGWGLMILGFFGADFAFLQYSGVWLGAPEWLGPVGAGVAGASLVVSLVWTVVLTSPARIRRHEQRVETAIREASLAYVRDDLNAASSAVDRGLRVAADDLDLIHLAWQIACARDDTPSERRLARRLRRLDVDEKWIWELDLEESRRG